jgi:hypothetical protein
MNRFTTRYGAPQHDPKPCSTPTCPNTASNLAGRCWRCANNLRRHAHCLQEVPLDTELAPLILRAERQRARHQRLDVEKLEAHYQAVVDGCRGKASPSYREHGKLTFNVTEREACAIVRDCAEGEGMTFTHCLDLMTALHLLRITRPYAFRSDDSGSSDDTFLAVMVEVFRRRSNVGRRWARSKPGATRQTTYRKEIARPVRLEAGRYLMAALGSAAKALATREARQADQDRETRSSYFNAVQAILDATA